jgi:hypothetical protein
MVITSLHVVLYKNGTQSTSDLCQLGTHVDPSIEILFVHQRHESIHEDCVSIFRLLGIHENTNCDVFRIHSYTFQMYTVYRVHRISLANPPCIYLFNSHDRWKTDPNKKQYCGENHCGDIAKQTLVACPHALSSCLPQIKSHVWRRYGNF